jgi:hypothetical protein
MAIFRRKTKKAIKYEKKLGIKNPDQYLQVPDFTYSSDSLAQWIVDAWVDKDYRDLLLQRDPDTGAVTQAAADAARKALHERGIYLERAVVISADEYYAGYTNPDEYPNEVVFVLPYNREDGVPEYATPRPGRSETLLETAKLLMATVPNGI